MLGQVPLLAAAERRKVGGGEGAGSRGESHQGEAVTQARREATDQADVERAREHGASAADHVELVVLASGDQAPDLHRVGSAGRLRVVALDRQDVRRQAGAALAGHEHVGRRRPEALEAAALNVERHRRFQNTAVEDRAAGCLCVAAGDEAQDPREHLDRAGVVEGLSDGRRSAAGGLSKSTGVVEQGGASEGGG